MPEVSTRTFVAVELGPSLQAMLVQRLRHLRQACPGLKWVDPENLHLTLTFLGELDQDQLSAAILAATAAAASSAPFRLNLSGLGIFGPSQMPRVIWAGVNGDLSALRRLQSNLVHEQDARNLPGNDIRFSPHLTLARLKQRLPEPERQHLLEALAQPFPPRRNPTLWVEQIAVMKSQLTSAAARYTRLAACPLLGAATV